MSGLGVSTVFLGWAWWWNLPRSACKTEVLPLSVQAGHPLHGLVTSCVCGLHQSPATAVGPLQS